jgi:Mlc titration factor MtfA (ptsG expression regulator)
MIEVLLLLVMVITIVFMGVVKARKIKAKREQILTQPFPDHWVKILKENVYLYNLLPIKYKTSLHNYIKVFLVEKEFIGKEGLEITEEIKLIIASQACLLLLHNPSNYFPYLKTIYVYPNLIVLNNNKQDSHKAFLGLSSVGHKSGSDGSILLSWSDVKQDSSRIKIGQNVVLHEFAHQLDQEFGNATGTPRLPNLQDTLVWGEILAHEYQQLCSDVKRSKPTIFNPYGVTNPVEFFAVITETFFTNPLPFKNKHLLLYDQLKKYYDLDPSQWIIE